MSHLIEHLMFSGLGPAHSDFDHLMESRGGANNAYTTRDLTVYTDWIPSSELEFTLALEARRLGGLAIDEAGFERERSVIRSERRATIEDDPYGILEERLYVDVYPGHPYGFPVTGRASDIDGWTVPRVEEYFRRLYSPANMVVAVVGDVSAEAFLALAKKYLEPLQWRAMNPLLPRTVQPQNSVRRIVVQHPSETAMQLFCFRVPPFGHPDEIPLRLLLEVAAGGLRSRLADRLIEHRHLAEDVNGWLAAAAQAGEVLVRVDLSPNADPRHTEHEVLSELQRLRREQVSNRELKGARNRLRARLAREMRTNTGFAELVGTYQVLSGDYHALFRRDEAIRITTRRDLLRVARAYLAEERLTIATLAPVQTASAGGTH